MDRCGNLLFRDGRYFRVNKMIGSGLLFSFYFLVEVLVFRAVDSMDSSPWLFWYVNFALV